MFRQHRTKRDERGQVLIIGALLIPVLLGMAAIAIDLGDYASHRRTLQNAADSIALAAARDLPDGSAARASADAWAAKNNIPAGSYTVTITAQGGGNDNPKVTVQITRPHNFGIMQVLGINSADVHGRAAAIKTSPGGAPGIVPWAILDATRDSAAIGDLITLKYDTTADPGQGNFGIIRVDGSGSAVYEDSVSYGADSIVCAQPTPGCEDTSPVCDSVSICPTETGNKVGPSGDAVDYRMDNTAPQCDEFGEVLTGPVNDKYTIVNECNPWVDGGYESHRLIIIPIINAFCNGSCDVTILDFAMFWLEGYDAGKCTGNSCEIKGRFVNAEHTVNALAGVYDPTSSIQFVRLSE